MLPALKKVTCHTNPLARIVISPSGALSYLSCSGCNLTAERLDSIFMALPTLSVVSASKNLYVLNNPGSSSCHSEIAAAKNWTLDRVITKSSFYMPSVSCKSADSIQANIYLKNTDPAIAFELDVLVPDGFELDTLRSCLSTARKGQHILSIARMPVSAKVYKIMAYSLKIKDSFLGTDGSVLELYLKAPAEIKTYLLDIQSAMLLDTMTNVMDISVTDGQMTVAATSLTGDANGDAKVDVTDIVNLVAWINGRRRADVDSTAIDIDGNGLWNVADVTKLVVIINSNGNFARSASLNSLDLDMGTLSLYHAGEVALGNHLFVRQSADDSSCLELCLDNTDAVQAFQADVILPEGLSLQTGQFSQKTERNAGHLLSVSNVSLNRYRLISYALKPDAAFSGKTGVLARLSLEGSDSISDGVYPVIVEQPVLTGMSLSSVTSKSYDALMKLGDQLKADETIIFGSDEESRLWVHGNGLLEFLVWDISGRLLLKKQLNGANFYSFPVRKGAYMVKARSRGEQELIKKVAVR